MRDLTNLAGTDLGIDDARVIDKELRDQRQRIHDYWADRQLAWKARACDVKKVVMEGTGIDDQRPLFYGGWTFGWPLMEIEEDTGLVKIGYEQPGGSTWVWVEYFQVDVASLIPEDEEYIVKEYSNLQLTA
jgi:hypothetical protein